MGVAITDDKLNSGWDISVSSVAAVKDAADVVPYVILNSMTVRDYNQTQNHARIRNTFPVLVVMGSRRADRGWQSLRQQ